MHNHADPKRACFFNGKGVPYEEITRELVLDIAPGMMWENRLLPVSLISPADAMKLSMSFDELPPMLQIVLKVLSIATRRALFKLPRTVAWGVINDIISEGFDTGRLAIVLNELEELQLLKQVVEGGTEKLAFQTPALADIVMDGKLPCFILL
jgi:hypothetical protein